MTSATAALRGPLRKRDSHLWARHPEDWYVEPEWVSNRLFVADLSLEKQVLKDVASGNLHHHCSC